MITLAILTQLILSPAANSDSNGKNIDEYYMDFSPTEVSAFSILDVKPSKIDRPGTVKELVIGVSNAVNESGSISPGFAIEWAPMMTFSKDANAWIDPSVLSSWRELQFSFATTSDSQSANIGLGAKWTLIDQSNPIKNPEWVSSFRGAFDSIVASSHGSHIWLAERKKFQNSLVVFFKKDLKFSDPDFLVVLKRFDIGRAEYVDSLRSLLSSEDRIQDSSKLVLIIGNAVKSDFVAQNLHALYSANKDSIDRKCEVFTRLVLSAPQKEHFVDAYKKYILKKKEEFKQQHWNALSVSMSSAIAYQSRTKKLKDIDKRVWAAILNTSIPLWFKNTAPKIGLGAFLRNHSQLILQARSQMFFLPDSGDYNEFSVGGRLLLGNEEKRGSAEFAYVLKEDNDGDIKDNSLQFSLGADTKISDNLWLEFAIGGKTTGTIESLSFSPNFGFKYSFGNESRFFKN